MRQLRQPNRNGEIDKANSTSIVKEIEKKEDVGCRESDSKLSAKRRRKKINLRDHSEHYKNNDSEEASRPTVEKVVANREQTGSAAPLKGIANKEQSSSKLVAGTSSKNGSLRRTDSKLVAQPVAEVIANKEQSGSKLGANTTFKQLSGLQRTLVETIYYSCRAIGSKISHPMAISYLSEVAKASIGTTKNALNRLVKKGIISKENFKNGRGGWTEYRLADYFYSEMLQTISDSNLVANGKQSGSKLVSQLVAEPVATAPSSSNSNKLNTITTEEGSSEWDGIQTPRILKDLGFGKGHINQIKNKFQYSPEEVQNFIEAYSHDIEIGKLLEKRKHISPIGYFFGALKNGGYVSSTAGFKTSEELAIEEQVRGLEERKKKRLELENKRFQLSFEEWLANTPDEMKKTIVEPIGEFMGTFHKVGLEDYFKNEVFNV